MVQKTEVVCRRTRLQDGWNVYCQNDKDRWNLEKCRGCFLLFYLLVGLLPAGGNKFSRFVTCISICPDDDRYEINMYT